MSILFEVNSATLVEREAHALAGFLDALFPGRKSEASAVFVPPAPAPAAPVALEAAPLVPTAPHDLAERLIQGEAARVAGLGLTEPAAGAVAYPVKLENGTEVDIEGLPWDKRIHSESKGLLKGGTWKIRRNVPDAEVAAVKDELRHVMAAPPALPVGITAPPAPGFVPPPPPTAAPVIQVEGSPLAPPVAPIVAQPLAVSAGASPPAIDQFAGATFADLMSRVVDLSVAGTPVATINGFCAELGLTQPRDANLRPDLIPALLSKLAAL